jgi:predicted HicB family RNase H-like nuclease
MGIKDVVTYEGDNLLDLLSQFQLSVDSYLEFCAEIGKEPDKPKKVRT